MSKDRKNTIDYLIDIRYKGSMNQFHEMYREDLAYADVEQESYVDLKQMVYESINNKIKFRKFERQGMTLRIKAEMTKEEHAKFLNLKNNNKFFFIHNYVISDVKQI